MLRLQNWFWENCFVFQGIFYFSPETAPRCNFPARSSVLAGPALAPTPVLGCFPQFFGTTELTTARFDLVRWPIPGAQGGGSLGGWPVRAGHVRWTEAWTGRVAGSVLLLRSRTSRLIFAVIYSMLWTLSPQPDAAAL